MALNIKPLPIDESGNGERIERVAFDRADALMLVHALSIASTTAYMCDSKRAADRLRHYRDIFMAMVPQVLRKLRREEDVTEIVVAMDTADTWDIRQEKGDYWSRDSGKCVTVVVGERTWTTFDRLSDEEFTQMGEAFAEFAPLSCVRVATEDATT